MGPDSDIGRFSPPQSMRWYIEPHSLQVTVSRIDNNLGPLAN